MTTPNPAVIATTELWISQLTIPHHTAEEAQALITKYVTESRIAIVGYINNTGDTLTLLRWPDLRPGYLPPNQAECNQSRTALAELFGAKIINTEPLQANTLHCMMGRKVGGYDDGRIASMDEVHQHIPTQHTEAVYMVSARPTTDGSIESYGEPAVAVIIPAANEASIHRLGDTLEQHHYVIERTKEGRTDFYETAWVDR